MEIYVEFGWALLTLMMTFLGYCIGRSHAEYLKNKRS